MPESNMLLEFVVRKRGRKDHSSATTFSQEPTFVDSLVTKGQEWCASDFDAVHKDKPDLSAADINKYP
jgi:hypothetical protein